MRTYTYIIGTRWAQAPNAQYFRKLADQMALNGHKVILLVSDQRQDIEDHRSNPAIYTWPSKSPTRLKDALFFLRLIRQFHPDGLISNFSSINIMMVLGWLCRIPVRIAWYRTILQSNILNNPENKIKVALMLFRRRQVYKFSSLIIANSKAAQEDLIRAYGVKRERTRVILNSLEDPIPNGATLEHQKSRLVCIGRFVPSKGQDVLIRALSLLKENHPKLKVEFIGGLTRDQEYVNRVQKMAEDLGVEKMCVYSGALSHDEVLERLKQAWITIFPTLSEAFGLVSIESMSVGTPVIASRVGGIPEVIVDEKDGILVPPNDPVALAEAVERIICNDGLHQKLSMNSRQSFLDRFETKALLRDQEKWFIQLVENSTTKR